MIEHAYDAESVIFHPTNVVRNETMRQAAKSALMPGVIKFSLSVAMLGGSVITFVNKADVIAAGGDFPLAEALLTFLTLYCMATFLAVTDR